MKRYLEFIDKSFRYLQQLCHSKDRFFASGFEFIPETGNGMSYRPGCSICLSTNCASFHLGRDIKYSIRFVYLTFPSFNLFKYFLTLSFSFTTRLTLAAGIVIYILGD